MEKLSKKITDKILPAFNNAKEWSDLAQIVSDLNKYLNSFLIPNENNKQADPNINLKDYKEKVTLSKRLAQCLNPSLPSGLHEKALESYKIILNNLVKHNNNCLGDDLALYCSGLFPFFQNASLPNKTTFLKDIVQSILLTIDKIEVEISLPGLLVSILPALEEQNESITKLIKDIFDSIIHKLDHKIFFGCLWSIIIRNERLRQAGMKYLLESIPSYEALIKESEEERKNIINKYYPKLNTMVLNALCSMIECDDVQTIRLGMDFVIKCFPINCDSSIITDDQKVQLLISALFLLVKNEYSTTRRLSTWLLGPNGSDEEIDLNSEESKYTLKLLTLAFKKIFNNAEPENCTRQRLGRTLKVIEQFTSQQVSFSDTILQEISADIISCVVRYWENVLNGGETEYKDDIINRTKQFFNKEAVFLEWLWNSLPKKLTNILNRQIEPGQQEDPAYNELFKSEIEAAVKPLKFCLLYINISLFDDRIKFYIPIISKLLKLIIRLPELGIKESKYMRYVLVIILVFLITLQEKENDEIPVNKKISLFSKISSQIEGKNIKVGGGKKSESRFNINEKASFASINSNEENQTIISEFTETILQFQEFYIGLVNNLLAQQESKNPKKMSQEELDKINSELNAANDGENNENNENNNKRIMSTLVDISRNDMRIFKQTTEVILRIQEYAQQSSIPNWLYCLEKIAFHSNTKLSLEGISYLLELLNIKSNENIFTLIKNDIRTTEINEEIISPEDLQDFEYLTNVKANCAECIFAKLYTTLEKTCDAEKVINLLVSYSEIDDYIDIFINAINFTVIAEEFEKNIRSIKLFTQFWKLSNEYYPEIIFFKNGECLFRILDFLDNSHPLLRHLSKSWLNQCQKNFKKIIDPLLRVLLSREVEWKLDTNGKLFVTKEYDCSRVMDAFRKLKNIIINANEIAVYYLIHTSTSDELLKEDPIGKEMHDICQRYIPTTSYLLFLVNISVRYIQAQLLKGMSKNFEKENYSVNASSCEFLEFLLTYIESKDDLMQIAMHISLSILDILLNNIVSRDEVMQVQLISLLKVLLFTKKNIFKEFIDQARGIFGSSLLNCIIKGIKMSSPFVRGHFISFLQCCLPIFSMVLDKEILIDVIKSLVENLGDFLFSRVIFNVNLGNNINIKDYHKFSLMNQNSDGYIIKNYLDEYKEYKRIDDADSGIIVAGLKEIVFHFLEVGPNPEFRNLSLELRKPEWKEISKKLQNSFKSQNSLGEMFAGLFSTSAFEDTPPQEKVDPKIMGAIYEGLLENLLASFIVNWTYGSDLYVPKDYCLNDLSILAPNIPPTGDCTNKKDEEYGVIGDALNRKSLKGQITEITFQLFFKNPIDFMSRFINLWGDVEKNKYVHEDKLYKLYMMELLMNMHIPLNILLLTINKILTIRTKTKYNKGKSKTFLVPTEQGIFEAKLCHMIYSFILLNNFEIEKRENSQEPLEFYREFNQFIKIMFENTKITYTLCWLYEIINLMMYRIPVSTISNSPDIKKELTNLHEMISKKLIDTTFNGKMDSLYESEEYLIQPIIPSIYTSTVKELNPNDNLYLKTEDLKQQREQNDGKGINALDATDAFKSSMMLTNTLTTQSKTNTEKNTKKNKMQGSVNFFYREFSEHHKLHNKITLGNELNNIYRKIAFLTLRNNYLSVTMKLFMDKPKELVNILISLIKQLIILTKANTVLGKEAFYHELSVEFLENIITNCELVAASSPGKQLVMDLFNEGNFFKTTPKMIVLWRNILSTLSNKQKDIIGELLSQMEGGFSFVRGSDQTKIKVLRRISFVVYSCEKDKFGDKLNTLKEKVKELFTSYGDNPVIESELFLMMRVLFLRCSHDNILDMIKSLWPIIFTELLSIIKNIKKNCNARLLFEALKFIELLSLANIEEFSLYQWIFILDTFDINKLNGKDPSSLINNILIKQKNIFKPIAMNIFKENSTWSVGFVEGNEGKPKTELIIVSQNNEPTYEGSNSGNKTNKKPSITTQEIGVLLKKFFYSIGDMNNYNAKVNYTQIEKIIEEDFLHNDDLGK